MAAVGFSRRDVLTMAAAALGLAACRPTPTASSQLTEFSVRHGGHRVRCLAASNAPGRVPPLGVVLLHGAGTDASQWVDIGITTAIDRVAHHPTPIVAVAPDVDLSLIHI